LCPESEITAENAIKLLLRTRKMYEAYALMVKILRLVFQVEKFRQELNDVSMPDEIDEKKVSLGRVASRLVSEVSYL
jgi:hypothetical protein